MKLTVLPLRRRQLLRRGDRLGDYEIVEPIASGGFGDVYEGLDLNLRRRVAIKVLQPRHARDADIRERFVREARSLARVRNRHVVEVHSAGQQDELAYIVMEFIQGAPLRDYLATEEPMPILDALHITASIANGVAAAHDEGIIHRDIKPENIYLDLDRVVVGDFGTAKVLSEANANQSERIIGTAGYIAPEQIRRAGVDFRTDVHGIGLVMYEMLTGRPAYPIGDMTVEEQLYVILKESPPRPEKVARYLAEYGYVCDIVWKAIQKDPRHRHASVRDLEQDCRDAQERLRREASPERARLLARVDARAPFLVPDTPAPHGSVDSSDEREQPARLQRDPRAALQAAAVLGVVAFGTLVGAFVFSPDPAREPVHAPPNPPGEQLTDGNFKLTPDLSLAQPSARPVSSVPEGAATASAAQQPEPELASAPAQVLTQLLPRAPLAESTNVRPKASGNARPVATVKSRPATLPAPPKNGPASVTDGCDPKKYRCTVF
jgi:serine/threonine protein kinase